MFCKLILSSTKLMLLLWILNVLLSFCLFVCLACRTFAVTEYWVSSMEVIFWNWNYQFFGMWKKSYRDQISLHHSNNILDCLLSREIYWDLYVLNNWWAQLCQFPQNVIDLFVFLISNNIAYSFNIELFTIP